MGLPTAYETGWITEAVGTFWRKEKYLALPGIEPRIIQSVYPILAVRTKWFVANI
jgi:hypothetical protein